MVGGATVGTSKEIIFLTQPDADLRQEMIRRRTSVCEWCSNRQINSAFCIVFKRELTPEEYEVGCDSVRITARGQLNAVEHFADTVKIHF